MKATVMIAGAMLACYALMGVGAHASAAKVSQSRADVVNAAIEAASK